MTRDDKQMHEYEGRMDEYGAINAYVKVTGRSHLSRTMLSRQDLHLTENIPFRVQKFSVGGGKDLQVAEVDRTATGQKHHRIVTLQAIVGRGHELFSNIKRPMSPFLRYYQIQSRL